MSKASAELARRRDRQAKANAKRTRDTQRRARVRQAQRARRAVAWVVFVLVVADALVLYFWLAGPRA